MKKIKFIQINIYKGKYLQKLLTFLKKEDPDFIAMQEVSEGIQNLNSDRSMNLFDYIKNSLNYTGRFSKDLDVFRDGETGFQGNALFSKYKIIDSSVLVLKKYERMAKDKADNPTSFPGVPRHILDCEIDFREKKIHVMSWHGAWTAPPTDTAETLRQAAIAADYLKKIEEPFLLGCDLNNIIGSKTESLISNVGINLLTGTSINQTTHPKVHKIVPRGYLIDFIYTSKEFGLKKISVPEATVSDHLPVVAELELE